MNGSGGRTGIDAEAACAHRQLETGEVKGPFRNLVTHDRSSACRSARASGAGDSGVATSSDSHRTETSAMASGITRQF